VSVRDVIVVVKNKNILALDFVGDSFKAGICLEKGFAGIRNEDVFQVWVCLAMN